MSQSQTTNPPNQYNDSGELEVYTNESYISYGTNYVGAQAGTTIITPTAGKKLEIVGIYVSTEDKLTDVTLDGSAGTEVFVLHTTNQQTSGATSLHLEMQTNETLDITCGAGTFVLITYYEE